MNRLSLQKAQLKKAILALFLILLSLLTWYGWKHYHRQSKLLPEPVVVSVTTVKTSVMPLSVNALGTVTARSVNITAEIAGHVRKILFKDGEFVTKKTPLIELDDAVYQTKLASAKAQYIFSERNYNRMSLLGKNGVVSQQAIDQADAELKEKRANVDETKVLIAKMKLTAPFNGKVGRRQINRGDYVAVGQTLVTITDTRHLQIEYTLPEKLLPDLKLGQSVKITSAAYPNKIFVGKLAFISPIINTDNHSILLYAELDNVTDDLAPGMFVNVQQGLGTEEQVLLVPSRSLVPALDNVQIYKIVNNKAVATDVILGRRINDEVQVLKGLSASDVIITDGQLKVKNGELVKLAT